MTLVYLDTCALQRPLDDRDQFRVRAEADAVTAVLAAVEAGTVALLTSPALRAETERSPHPSRRDFAARALALAPRDAGAVGPVEARARAFEGEGIKPFDALHLASALAAGADYFCTADDRLLRKARAANTAPTRIVTPVELATALGL